MAATDVRLASYLAVGVASLVKWRTERAHGGPEFQDSRFGWLLLGGGWIALALLQYGGAFKELGDYWRSEAYAQGWYGSRRPIQAVVILGILTVGAITAVGLCAIPARLGRYRLAYALSFAAASFILVRNVSLHALDSALGQKLVEGVKAGDAVEIGAALVVLTAVVAARA